MVLFADNKKGMLCFRTFEWGYIFRINFVLDGANAKLGDEEMNGPRSLKWLIFGLYARVAWRGRGIYFNGPLLFDRIALFSTKSLNFQLTDSSDFVFISLNTQNLSCSNHVLSNQLSSK